MIDRCARNKLAELLRHLVSGQLTNYQFDDAVDAAGIVKSDDAAIGAIRRQAWQLYSDLREHRLTGRDAVSESGRRIVARSILFLHSDLDYEWPRHPLEGLTRLLSHLLSLGVIPRRVDKKWEAAGDVDVWPFIRRKDYEEALDNPKLLRGRAA